MNLRLFTLATLAFCKVTAQDTAAIHQLQSRLQAATADTDRVWLYNDLFVAYREADSAQAMNAINKGIELSNKIHYEKGESQLLLNKGTFLNINGENSTAQSLIQQSLQIRTATGDVSGQGYCLRALGNIEHDKNNFEAALKLYLASAAKFEAAHDKKGMAGTYIWIGNVFNKGLFQYSKAAGYFNKSLQIAMELKDSMMIGYNYNNLGIAYYNAKDFPQALQYYQRSKDLRERLGDTQGVAVAYGNISNIYFDEKNYPRAIACNDSSLQLRIRINDKPGMAATWANGGNIYMATNQLEQAFDFYQRAIQLGNEIEYREPVIESYSGLSNYYEKKGNTTLALDYYKKYKAASDSVYNADIAAQLQTLEVKFEAANKEKQIQEQQFGITRRNYGLAAAGGLLFLGSLLGYSYYRRYRLKKEKQLQQEIMHQQDMATRAVLQAEEKERQRIALELHDGVGQMMSAAKMNLSAFESEMAGQTEKQRHAFDKIIGLVDESCREVRAVSHQMMPNALLKSGLASAIRDFIEKLDNNVLKVNLHTEGLNERLSPDVEAVLYRVVQECVNNVVKHSGANHLDISLIRDTDGLSITIEDNGKGFDNSSPGQEGIGLQNIRSRVQYLKGTVEWDSAKGQGTLVAIHIPTI